MQDSTCNFHAPTPGSTCESLAGSVMQEVYGDGVDIYNVDGVCFHNSDPRRMRAADSLFRNYPAKFKTSSVRRSSPSKLGQVHS